MNGDGEGISQRLDAVIEPVLTAGRVPGAAVAVVNHNRLIFAKGYGYRDVAAGLPATPTTAYPIASTTKALNATLLGILVDQGMLAWDEPVQTYLPSFRLGDASNSAQVTIRDLIALRTGLPPHDWAWIGASFSRAELVRRIAHLELAARPRERFLYNNLTVTTAGHLAEIVTGESWEDLVQQYLLDPLGMSETTFNRPLSGNVTRSYFETRDRELRETDLLRGEVTAPSGGAIYSTVEDMAKWMIFNLQGGMWHGRQIIRPSTLADIWSPQTIVPPNFTWGLADNVAYAMGWFTDTYRGRPRVLHGGYHHDVNSDLQLLKHDDIGIVCFTNFGFPKLARFISHEILGALRNLPPAQTITDRLAEYEKAIKEAGRRNGVVPRVQGTVPSHPIEGYVGRYFHPGYGDFEIVCENEGLVLRRRGMALAIRHWHYDCWTVANGDFVGIHMAHAFDVAGQIQFHTAVDGHISAFSLGLEAMVSPIRFEKRSSG